MGTMREARLKAPEDHAVACCHTISQVVNREFMPGEEEREQFVEMTRCHEHFCGVRVLPYCVMNNHFHLLAAVPRRPATLPGDAGLLARAEAVFSPQALAAYRAFAFEAAAEALDAGRALPGVEGVSALRDFKKETIERPPMPSKAVKNADEANKQSLLQHASNSKRRTSPILQKLPFSFRAPSRTEQSRYGKVRKIRVPIWTVSNHHFDFLVWKADDVVRCDHASVPRHSKASPRATPIQPGFTFIDKIRGLVSHLRNKAFFVKLSAFLLHLGT